MDETLSTAGGSTRGTGVPWPHGAVRTTGGGATLAGVRPRRLTVALAGDGGWLADATVRALLRDGDRVVRLPDPEDAPAQPAPRGADVVLHLAAGPRETSLRGQSAPALQTLAALHAARADGARLVIASLPGNAAHLAADEALAEGFRSAHDVDTVVVRVAECYGPGMPVDRTGVLARMLHQARTAGVVVVDAEDDGEHHVCFVDDAVAGLLHLLRAPALPAQALPGPALLLGPARGLPTLALARTVAEITGAGCRVRERRRLRVAPEPSATAPRPAPAAHRPRASVPGGTVPGWRCRVDLVDGLTRWLAAEPVAPPAALVGGRERTDVVDLRDAATELRPTGVPTDAHDGATVVEADGRPALEGRHDLPAVVDARCPDARDGRDPVVVGDVVA